MIYSVNKDENIQNIQVCSKMGKNWPLGKREEDRDREREKETEREKKTYRL